MPRSLSSPEDWLLEVVANVRIHRPELVVEVVVEAIPGWRLLLVPIQFCLPHRFDLEVKADRS